MKKLLWYARKYMDDMTLGDMAALKVCLLSIGAMLGLCVPKKSKKTVGLIAGLCFVLTYVPLISRLVSDLFPRHKKLVNGHQIEMVGR